MTAGERSPASALFVGADLKYMIDFRAPLITAQVARGRPVTILAAPTPGFDDGAAARLGVRFIPWQLRRTALNPVADLSALAGLWRVLRRERPGLVFAHAVKPVIYAMVLARLAGVRTRVAMIPGLGYAFGRDGGLKARLVSMTAQGAYALATRCADLVIFQNTDDRDELLARGALSPRTATTVVNGSGVDMQRFVQAPSPDGPTTFLMAARLIRDKGVHDFVAAARRVRTAMPQTRFVLIGATDANPNAVTETELQAWRREGLIEIRGQVADPRQAFADCHVFVLPSYYREGVPRTNLEALATGRAVITCDTPGCRETVRDGVNGLLVPPRDPAALAEAMLALARDPARTRAMGEAGRALCAERFELGTVTRATLSAMDDAEMSQGRPDA